MRRLKFPESKGRKIKLLITDVDGVLTDGKIILGSKGEEFKNFHVQDGTGMYLGIRAGLKIAMISARKSRVTRRRAREVGVSDVFEVEGSKEAAYERLRRKYGLKHSEIAYIGDDVHDIEVLGKVGLAITVPDGVPEVKRIAHYVTGKAGGKGAVREVIDLLLKCNRKKLASFLKYCIALIVFCFPLSLLSVRDVVAADTHSIGGEKIEGGFLYTITEGGKVTLKIEGVKATGLSTDTVHIEKPVVKWFSENSVVTIKADTGVLEKKTNDIHFKGDVSVESKEWGKMKCAELDWDSDQKKMTAKGTAAGVFYLDRYHDKENGEKSKDEGAPPAE